MRKTIIHKASGKIINVIDAPDDWRVADEHMIRDYEEGDAIDEEPTASPRSITPREFMDRLTMERQAQVTAAAMQSAPMLLWMMRLTGALEVQLDLPETQEGVAALRAAGVITAAEAAALLA